jgi:hypothetical protein
MAAPLVRCSDKGSTRQPTPLPQKKHSLGHRTLPHRSGPCRAPQHQLFWQFCRHRRPARHKASAMPQTPRMLQQTGGAPAHGVGEGMATQLCRLQGRSLLSAAANRQPRLQSGTGAGAAGASTHATRQLQQKTSPQCRRQCLRRGTKHATDHRLPYAVSFTASTPHTWHTDECTATWPLLHLCRSARADTQHAPHRVPAASAPVGTCTDAATPHVLHHARRPQRACGRLLAVKHACMALT